MPNASNTTMKVEDIGAANGQVKDGEQLVEINGHYMVKRTDDTWRKLLNVGDKRGGLILSALNCLFWW